jgi:hypothetical protein
MHRACAGASSPGEAASAGWSLGCAGRRVGGAERQRGAHAQDDVAVQRPARVDGAGLDHAVHHLRDTRALASCRRPARLGRRRAHQAGRRQGGGLAAHVSNDASTHRLRLSLPLPWLATLPGATARGCRRSAVAGARRRAARLRQRLRGLRGGHCGPEQDLRGQEALRADLAAEARAGLRGRALPHARVPARVGGVLRMLLRAGERGGA